MGVPSDFGALARADVLSSAGLARARLDAELPATPIRRRPAGGGGDLGEVRPGGRGPAGGSAARRGVRGPQRGAVVRGDAARAGRGGPAAPRRWPRPRAPCCRRQSDAAQVRPCLRHAGRRPRHAAPGRGRGVRGARCAPGPWSASWPVSRTAGGWSSDRPASPRPCMPTRSSWPCPPGRPAGCWPPVAGRRAAALGRDPLREHGDRHAGLPARRRSPRRWPAAATWCPPWTGARSRRSPSAPSSGRTCCPPSPRTACTSSGARSAGSARRRSCSGTTPNWPRWPRGSSPPPPGSAARPPTSRVTRWGGGLPQYSVGHLDRVARIRAAVAAQPGLAVCGAAYDGLGIPACIATAPGGCRPGAQHLANRGGGHDGTTAADGGQ